MKKDDYIKQIKSPKWQRRRLEIMNTDNFTCQICGDKENSLNVHHLCYDRDNDIHEYKDTELMTLCEDCHQSEHDPELLNDKIHSLNRHGVTNSEICSFLEFLDILIFQGHDYAIPEFFCVEREDPDYGFLYNLADRRSKLRSK